MLWHMSATNVVDGARSELGSRQGREAVPRKRKPVKGEQVHLSVMVEADVIRAIDTEAERMTLSDPMRRQTTRTDVVRHWLRTMAEKVSKAK